VTDLLGTGISVLDVGAGGFVGVVVLMLLTGRLITKPAHDQVVKELKESHADALTDRDRQIVDWRDAYRAEAATNAVQSAQVEKLVEQGRTFVHLLDSLRSMFIPPQSGGTGDE
jgi:hypothetical protein